MKNESPKLNLKVFIEQLIAFSEEANFNMCTPFKRLLEDCDNASQIKGLFHLYAEDIVDRIGYEPRERDCNTCESLRDEISELQEELNTVNAGISDERVLRSLDFKQKIEAFHKHHNRFTSYQFEEMLEKA